MKASVNASALALLLVMGQAAALDESALAQESGCFACHRGAAKRLGPSYKDVAERYAGMQNAEAVLARRIVDGTGPGLGWMKEDKARLPLMPPNDNVSPENALRLARWILGIEGEVVADAYFVTESVTVSGAVENPLELSVEDLRRFAHPQEIRVDYRSGGQRQLKGVLLRDILKKAVLVAHSPLDAKKAFIIATASDGWRVVFSWTEVLDSPLGEGALVIIEKDGRPLADDEGRIALVSAGDVHAESRHLKWLKTIEVRKIAD